MPGAAQISDWAALSSPAPGQPLVTRVERLAGPLRERVQLLADRLDAGPASFAALWGPRAGGLGYSMPAGKELAVRAARCVLGEWLVGYATGNIPSTASFRDAHHWWIAGLPLSGLLTVPEVPPPWDAGSAPGPAVVRGLLPYLLDPLAPATRRDLLRGTPVHRERRLRKAAGVYFTPGDVASFLVRGAGPGQRPATWLDPAAGSGVFLRAVLEIYPESAVYGIDIDPAAAESAAFVLTATSVANPADAAPWFCWHRHRLNLVTADSLALRLTGAAPGLVAERRAERHQALAALADEDTGTPALPAAGLGGDSVWSLPEALPELIDGAGVIVQNPPYAAPAAGKSQLLSNRWGAPLPPNVYPLFLELGIDLAARNGQLAAVVPASLATSTVAGIRRCRDALARAAGDLELLCFDRAPDGLFGDDIKTRCTIVFLDKSARRSLRLGPLTRMTSGSRSSALVRGAGAELSQQELTAPRPPKLGSEAERILLDAAGRAQWSIAQLLSDFSVGPINGPAHTECQVLVGPTAYNWLNVVRDGHAARRAGHEALNPFLRLELPDPETADAVYGLLCSRTALWLWRVHGDGFHVGRWLLQVLPAPSHDDREMLRAFAKLGSELWARVAGEPVRSRNGGRVSVAFPHGPLTQGLLDEVDQRLLELIGLSEPPLSLRQWARTIASVGRETERPGTVPW